MSGGVDMIASAVVHRVTGMLGNVAWERLQLLWNYKEDVQDMEGKMVTLQIALSYADKRSREADDALVQHWLKKYKSVAYDIEDMLDELVANVTVWENSPCTVKLFFSSINPLIVRITTSNKMRNIRLELDKISEDQKKFPFLPLPTPTGHDTNKKWSETFIGDRDELEMVGREREKNEILIKIGGSTPAKDAHLQYLKSQLDHILCDKFYLIVLDDLWEEGRSKLEDLMKLLQSGKKGSCLIVTTRSEKVASTLSYIHSSYFHTTDPIKLEGMSIDECWSIMKPCKVGNAQVTDLVDIGKEIAQKCSGVPLVAKALGYVMQKHCTRAEWLEIKKSNMLDIRDDDKGILKGLLLSYYHMPPELQLCFIDRQPLQKIGSEYVNEFLGMSFLNVLTYTVSAARLFKPTLKLRMHDMVHDLARYVAADEFSYTNGATNINTKGGKANCHYHLLINQNETSLTYKAFPTKIRALHSRECDKMNLPEQAFSQTLCLRVLDLSGCRVSQLPSSVCKLNLLRYLDASNLPISNLPKSLYRLLNLQTLILSNTYLETLPTNIGCLQKLQYFDLSGCVNFRELPISFGNLSAMLFLNMSSCHELHTLPESFGKLHKVQFFNLSDCYKLRSLPESCCQLHDLTHLELSDCHNIEKLPDCIGQLSKLEYLNMTSCSKVHMLPESVCKLTMLKHLDLSFCINLEHLPSSIGDLRLQHLNLVGCFALTDLPDSIFSISMLLHVERSILGSSIDSNVDKLRKKLNLKGSFVLDGGSGDLWSQITELKKAHCCELEINGLENVELLEGAEQAKLSNNLNLTWLILSWDRDEGSEDSVVEHADATADKELLEKLLPPRSLQCLNLGGYMSRDFPRWLLDIPSYLPHLTTIVLADLKACSHLPPFGCLPNLRVLLLSGMPSIKSVGMDFCRDYGSCQKLRVIGLYSMDSLEEWWTTRSSNEDGEFLIPNLHLLDVSDCSKLKFLPYPPISLAWTLKKGCLLLT
ncbi:unnamed protein product [Urochloa decumbens]|uniref:Uncharacterized protein n=1 Tax=Urochloa decumbens TaxID=240449 RepID=A0ABC8Z2E4_9POAL